jgi:hypothetical protein
MITIERGITKKITASFYDQNDVLTDPDTGTIKIAVFFEDGTTYLAETSMTKSSTGVYFYYWTIATSDSIGLYTIVITATFASTKIHTNRDEVYVTDTIIGA